MKSKPLERQRAARRAAHNAKRRQAIAAATAENTRRREASFDGLLGTAPEWLKGASQKQWHEAREFALNHYPEAMVRAWLEGKDSAPDNDELRDALLVLLVVWRQHHAMKEQKRLQNLPSGPKAAGVKSAAEKSERHKQITKAIASLRKTHMCLNWSAQDLAQALKREEAQHFESGKAPYDGFDGLYRAVLKVLQQS